MSMNGTCKCGKEATTKCDKCDYGVCIKCATIIPVPPAVSESLIRITHQNCAPNKHLAKIQIKGEEING